MKFPLYARKVSEQALDQDWWALDRNILGPSNYWKIQILLLQHIRPLENISPFLLKDQLTPFHPSLTTFLRMNGLCISYLPPVVSY